MNRKNTNKAFLICVCILLALLIACCQINKRHPILSIRPVPTPKVSAGPKPPSLSTYIPPTAKPVPRSITISSASGLSLSHRLGTGLIQDAHWSEDGGQLIVTTSHGVNFYEAETLDLMESYSLGHEYVMADISSLRMVAVVVDIDGTSNLIDVKTGAEIRKLRDDWTVFQWSPDDTHLGIGHFDGSVHLVNTQTGELERDFTLSRFEIEEVTFSPNGGVLVAKDKEGWFVFWDLSDGSEILRDRIMLGRGYQISEDEQTFVFISGLGSLKVWTLPDEWTRWDIVAEVYGPKVSGFTIDHEKDQIIVEYQDEFIKEVRDFSTGEKLGITAEREHYLGGSHPELNIKFTILDQNNVEIRDLENSILASASVHGYGECLAFLPLGNEIITNTGIWNIWTGDKVYPLRGDCPIQPSLEFRSLGIRQDDYFLNILDLMGEDQETGVYCSKYSWDIRGEVQNWSISPDGSMIACYSREGKVVIYSLPSGDEITRLETIQYETELAFSADSRYLGALSHGFLRVWDLETGSLVHDPIRVEEPVTWWVSEDLMTWLFHYKAGTDSILTWDPRQDDELSRIWLDTEDYFESIFSPDGTMLIIAKPDGIEIWSTETGQILTSQEWPRGFPREIRLAMSPDNKWLVMYLPNGPFWFWGVLE